MLSKNPEETAEYLLKVVQNSPALIYVFNQNVGQNEYANRNISDLLGYSSAEVLQLGLDLMSENLHPLDAARVFQHIEGLRHLADGEVSKIAYRMRHRDGHWVHLLSYDRVFERDADGTVISHIGVAIETSGMEAEEAFPLAQSA